MKKISVLIIFFVLSLASLGIVNAQNDIILSESGYYMFEGLWVNAVAVINVYLQSPEDKYIATFSGLFSDMGDPIILGEMNSDDHLSFRFVSTLYGKEYYADSTDPADCIVEQLETSSWNFTCTDGVGDNFHYNDISFKVYLADLCDDNDNDGYGIEGSLGCTYPGIDCNDYHYLIYPGASEICDGLDNNCDDIIPANEADDDNDGYMICKGDCDDLDDTVYPNARELCDGKDNDCDGETDEGFACIPCLSLNITSYRELYYTPTSKADGDNKCNENWPGTHWCNVEELENKQITKIGHKGYNLGSRQIAYVDDNSGCNNGFICSIHYWKKCGTQVCENKLCNNEGLLCCPRVCIDDDYDGFGSDNLDKCDDPTPDCDDNDINIYPGAAELCNNIDDDCDSSIDDDGVDEAWYNQITSCGVGECTEAGNYICSGGAQTDTCTPGIPIAEICDGLDNDCNGVNDNGFDLDSDGYTSCVGDCDDNNDLMFPYNPEVCDDLDNDCNNIIDDGTCAGQCVDNDNDKYGVNNDPSCQRVGYDCDDDNKKANPGKAEACNTPFDDDCDGIANNGCDNDLDGYLAPDECNDYDPSVNPGATEVCNSKDDDCDGEIDENGGCSDTDGDNIVDAVDICPLDPDNNCNVNKTQEYVASNSSTLLTTQNGDTSLQIDSGDLATDTVLTVERNPALEPNFALATKKGDAAKTIYSYTFSPEGQQFIGDVMITMYWQDIDDDGNEDVTGLGEDKIKMYWYNPITDKWEDQGANCDLVNNYCTLMINHFSDYTLAAIADSDGDGFSGEDDCDDNNSLINPNATEVCNAVDDNCDGNIDEGDVCCPDNDNDGYLDASCGGADCNDADIAVYPGAVEICDGIDNNCDGSLDEGDLCGDGLFCNGIETCGGIEGCLPGIFVDCSYYDLLQIAACYNDPDNNPFTFDYFSGFNSLCDEEADSCTSGTIELTHTCSVDECSADCETNDDCEATECDDLDDCYDGTYMDYDDVDNVCVDCICTENECDVYTEIITDVDNDGFDVECDNDCDDYDFDVNPGTFEIPGNNIDENCDSVVLCDSTAKWKNHGKYVSCVTKETKKLVKQGLITKKEKNEIVRNAAKSDVGKKDKAKKEKKAKGKKK